MPYVKVASMPLRSFESVAVEWNRSAPLLLPKSPHKAHPTFLILLDLYVPIAIMFSLDDDIRVPVSISGSVAFMLQHLLLLFQGTDLGPDTALITIRALAAFRYNELESRHRIGASPFYRVFNDDFFMCCNGT